MNWFNKKLDYMLSLTRDGRVFSSGFSMKSENVIGSGTDSSKGQGFIVPTGVLIRNNESNKEYAPGEYVRANKRTFAEFQEFLNSGSREASKWAIIDMSSVASQQITSSGRGKGEKGSPSQSIFGLAKGSTLSKALSTFRIGIIDAVDNLAQLYKEREFRTFTKTMSPEERDKHRELFKQIEDIEEESGKNDIFTPKAMLALRDFLLSNYTAQLEEGFAKRDEEGNITRGEDGSVEFNLVTGDDGTQLAQHISGVKVDAKYLDYIPANIDFAIEMLLKKRDKEQVARKIFQGASPQASFEALTGLQTRMRGVPKKEPEGAQRKIVKTPKEKLVTTLQSSLIAISSARGFVESVIGNSEDKNNSLALLDNVRDGILQAYSDAVKLEDNVDVTDARFVNITKIHQTSIKNLDSLTKILENQSQYAVAFKNLKFSIDSAKLKAQMNELSIQLEGLDDDSPEKARLQSVYTTLELLNVSENINNFIISSSERFGISVEEIKKFLLDTFEGYFSENQEDGSISVVKSFSLDSGSKMFDELSVFFGLKNPSFSDVFTPFSVLTDKDLLQSLYPELQIRDYAAAHVVSQRLGSEINEKLTEFMEKHDIKAILGTANDEERNNKVKTLLAKLKGIKNPMAAYFIRRIEDNLIRQERVLRVGEFKTSETETAEKFRSVENFVASLLSSSSEYNLKESSHRFKYNALKILHHFSNYENPHSLTMFYSSILGVHLNNGNLVMNSKIRELLESNVYENNELASKYNGLGTESEKVAFLVDFFSKNHDKIEFPLALLATARMESFTEKQGFVSYEDSSINLPITSLPGITDFIGDLKKALKSNRERIKTVCANALLPLYGISASKSKDIALDYLYQTSIGFLGGEAKDGYYTEALVNLHIASQLGDITGYKHSTDPETPSVLQIQGRDGKRYEILTHATDKAGYGDSNVVEYNNGRVIVRTVEQKTSKKNTARVAPHLGDVSGTSQVLDYLQRTTGSPIVKGNSLGIYIDTDSGDVSVDSNLVAQLDASFRGHTVQGKSAVSKLR